MFVFLSDFKFYSKSLLKTEYFQKWHNKIFYTIVRKLLKCYQLGKLYINSEKFIINNHSNFYASFFEILRDASD